MFRAASRALSEALVLEARAALREADHGRASALCREAVQRAHDARSPALELGAERELGSCMLAAGQLEDAMATFRSFLALAKANDSAKDIVTAHLKLALCYHKRSDMAGTLGALRDARRAAEELKLPELLARAHLHLGEHFLNTSRPQYATTHLHQACELASETNKAEADRARALAGVAGGLELWPAVLAALVESGPDQPDALRRGRLLDLVAWKDRRAPFWPKDLTVSKAVLQSQSTVS
ncbi:Sterol uptake control protein 2 [Frankliniella fusca]|uniref:Tetratricopeptide repeat protein 29 n=1 Tax=Frankliniella fusca TaxID=407009 RepID=A0AAE1LUS3_9NEOP|nr:Sterol uptake control protein 2 [Frankliniella fusca]